jgi:hypothetical protein
MYGGEGGTVDTIRGLFTSGFGLGEALEGVAQSLPEGLRERFAQNGLRGIFGRPGGAGQFKAAMDTLGKLVQQHFATTQARQLPFNAALATLEQQAGEDAQAQSAVTLLKDMNQQGAFDDVEFAKVWALLQTAAKSVD